MKRKMPTKSIKEDTSNDMQSMNIDQVDVSVSRDDNDNNDDDDDDDDKARCCTFRWCYDQLGCHRDRPENANVHEQLSWVEERRRRVPPRTCTAAILLFTFGTLLVTLGLHTFYKGEREAGINMLVIGGLMFLPGSYASWILYGAWKRWPNYEYHQVPSYDE